jgi:hypothetical protein
VAFSSWGCDRVVAADSSGERPSATGHLQQQGVVGILAVDLEQVEDLLKAICDTVAVQVSCSAVRDNEHGLLC